MLKPERSYRFGKMESKSRASHDDRYSYELRDYGLAHPEEFPAFGVAENVSWNSRKSESKSQDSGTERLRFGFEAGTAAKASSGRSSGHFLGFLE